MTLQEGEWERGSQGTKQKEKTANDTWRDGGNTQTRVQASRATKPRRKYQETRESMRTPAWQVKPNRGLVGCRKPPSLENRALLNCGTPMYGLHNGTPANFIGGGTRPSLIHNGNTPVCDPLTLVRNIFNCDPAAMLAIKPRTDNRKATDCRTIAVTS